MIILAATYTLHRRHSVTLTSQVFGQGQAKASVTPGDEDRLVPDLELERGLEDGEAGGPGGEDGQPRGQGEAEEGEERGQAEAGDQSQKQPLVTIQVKAELEDHDHW